MADALSEAAEKLLAKNVLDRFTRYVAIQQEILSSGKSLMEADSYDAAYERFRVLVKHAENLWDDACALFERGSFATALALTITCLEEIGKGFA